MGALFIVVAACGGRPAPTASAPATTVCAETASASQSASTAHTTSAPAPHAKAAPREEDVRAFLAPRDGEEPADKAAIPGVSEPSAAETALLAKCAAAREKALERTKKLSGDKQLAAAFKAMKTADKRCLDVGLSNQMQSSARARDDNAQLEMRALAKGLAKGAEDGCGDGAANPAASMGACFLSLEPLLWDRTGWSCLAKGLSETDKDLFHFKASYVYSFHTDAALRTYELVGRGCQMLLGSDRSNAETELVLRGRVGDTTTEPAIYRRKPSDAAK